MHRFFFTFHGNSGTVQYKNLSWEICDAAMKDNSIAEKLSRGLCFTRNRQFPICRLKCKQWESLGLPSILWLCCKTVWGHMLDMPARINRELLPEGTFHGWIQDPPQALIPLEPVFKEIIQWAFLSMCLNSFPFFPSILRRHRDEGFSMSCTQMAKIITLSTFYSHFLLLIWCWKRPLAILSHTNLRAIWSDFLSLHSDNAAGI